MTGGRETQPERTVLSWQRTGLGMLAVAGLLARALREQVDWERVCREVAGNDFAAVFLVLLDRLGIVQPLSGD